MPRTKRSLQRLPPINSCLIAAWLGVFAVAVVALVYLAISAIMGGPQYLYHKEDGDDASYAPVIEYQGKDDDPEPDFLYPPQDNAGFRPPPRMVEFYAPWCPHCRHYSPEYIKLARKVTAAQPSVKFYAVSCVAHKDVCKDQKVGSYPTIKLFQEGSYEKLNVTKKGIRSNANSVLRELGFEGIGDGGEDTVASKSEYEAQHKKLRHEEKGQTSDGEHKELARVIPFRVHDVHDAWFDAAESFEFALKHGVYMENGPLPEARAAALREWLELLSKSLPAQMYRTHGIINTLLDEFSHATAGQMHLDKLVTVHAPTEPKWHWRTCTYGDNAMGYTCGLWQLFHIMSVGVVEYNMHNPPIPTRHASETLRNYIDNFFQCDVCRLNFLDMYDNCAFHGCDRLSESPSAAEKDWKELPLWLWETHNDVNVRLMGERLEQSKEPKPNEWETQQARYPALFACPNCWRQDNSWEEDEVYKFLHGTYWHGNPSYLRTPSEDMLDGSRVGSLIPIRWKVSAIILAVFAVLAHLSTTKRIRRKDKK